MTKSFSQPVLRIVAVVFSLLLICLFSVNCGSTRNQAEDKGWWESADPVPKGSDSDVVRTSQYLTMRDGVLIAVDLYLPKDFQPGTKLPTILLQTRYWRYFALRWPFSYIIPMPEELVRLVKSGYAVVRVDARGSGASFGTRPYPWSPDEVKDGGEVVDWIIAQNWSNQKVGAAGGSYEGTAAEFILVNNHPAVKAVAPLFSLYDVYTDIAYPGGIHLEWFTKTWEKGNDHLDSNTIGDLVWWTPFFIWGVSPVDADRDRAMLGAASKEHASNYRVNEEAGRITFRDDTTPNGFNAGAFSPHTYKDKLESSNAAIYSISGWYDGGYAHAAIKRYLTLSNPGSKLLLGPWDHGGDDRIRALGKTVKTDFDMVGELVRFFDYHLKGVDSGIYNEAPVHYYTMVQNQWKSAQSWPPKADRKKWFFAEKSGLSENAPALADAADSYTPAPAFGTGNTARWNALADEVAVTYPDRAKKDAGLLVYQSPALTKDTEVTGHPIVTLYLETNAADAQVFVYLEDVDPTGRVGMVSEGMLRAIHRNLSDETPPYKTPTPYRTFKAKDAQPLTPGQPAVLTFDLLPTSYMFKKGHRIRIAIAGFDADHFKSQADAPQSFRILRSINRASFVDLPVVTDGQ
jgi:hypothetical protein